MAVLPEGGKGRGEGRLTHTALSFCFSRLHVSHRHGREFGIATVSDAEVSVFYPEPRIVYRTFYFWTFNSFQPRMERPVSRVHRDQSIFRHPSALLFKMHEINEHRARQQWPHSRFDVVVVCIVVVIVVGCVRIDLARKCIKGRRNADKCLV